MLDFTRRRFLAFIGGSAAAAMTPSVVTRASAQTGEVATGIAPGLRFTPGRKRNIFVVPARCTRRLNQ